MLRPTLKVFISYSSEDRAVVSPVVMLLRTMRSNVFLAFQDIEPAHEWRKEIKQSLGKADVVVVFWCYHSRTSPEVTEEWQSGVRLRKRLLPILLDSTKLPDELAKFQGIDFRTLAKASHTPNASAESPECQDLKGMAPSAMDFALPLIVVGLFIANFIGLHLPISMLFFILLLLILLGLCFHFWGRRFDRLIRHMYDVRRQAWMSKTMARLIYRQLSIEPQPSKDTF